MVKANNDKLPYFALHPLSPCLFPLLFSTTPSRRKKRENPEREGLGERVWLVKSKTEQLGSKREKKGKKGHMGFIH
jgi:hypothetical protein